MRSIATEPKKAEGNVLVPAAALEKLLDGRELYFHPKTGNVYALVLRRPLRSPLFEGEMVYLVPAWNDSRQALVTDSMSSGEVVFYQNISTGDFYARPAAMFDEPQRFVRLPLAVPALTDADRLVREWAAADAGIQAEYTRPRTVMEGNGQLNELQRRKLAAEQAMHVLAAEAQP